MGRNNRTYSNIALWVAGIGLLLTLGYLFVQRAFDFYVQVGTAVVVIAAALIVFFDPVRARKVITGRQVRYGSNAILLFIAFVASVVTINYLVYQNAQDWGLRWDLTADKERTLTQESINTLGEIAALDSPVVVQMFFSEFSPGLNRAEELIEDFQFHADGNLPYEVIDPNLNPVAVQESGISQDGTIVLSHNGVVQQITVITEFEITNALIGLLSPNFKTVYFLTGHGEYNLDQGGDDSLRALGSALQGKQYIVASLDLVLEPSVPADAAAVFIAGPIQPVSVEEMNKIRNFIDAGGALIIAQDPLPQTDFGTSPDPVNEYLLDEWGITLGEDIVIEPQAVQALGGLYSVSVSFGSMEITDDLVQRDLRIIFPVARSVTVINSAVENVTPSPLVFTSPESWAETNIDSINQGSPAPDEKDIPGPISVAVAAENNLTGSRIVVFGDSDFLSDGGITQYGNQDLLLNSVDWSTRQEKLIKLTPRQITQRLIVPPDQSTLSIIAILTVCLLPGGVLIGGILVWVGRRRQV